MPDIKQRRPYKHPFSAEVKKFHNTTEAQEDKSSGPAHTSKEDQVCLGPTWQMFVMFSKTSTNGDSYNFPDNLSPSLPLL